jgi:hypothetical protein
LTFLKPHVEITDLSLQELANKIAEKPSLCSLMNGFFQNLTPELYSGPGFRNLLRTFLGVSDYGSFRSLTEFLRDIVLPDELRGYLSKVILELHPRRQSWVAGSLFSGHEAEQYRPLLHEFLAIGHPEVLSNLGWSVFGWDNAKLFQPELNQLLMKLPEETPELAKKAKQGILSSRNELIRRVFSRTKDPLSLQESILFVVKALDQASALEMTKALIKKDADPRWMALQQAVLESDRRKRLELVEQLLGSMKLDSSSDAKSLIECLRSAISN